MLFLHILKTAGKIIGVAILCLLISGFVIGMFYGKEIKQLIITELNNHLDSKIHVSEFDFSVLRHFPYASFELKNVMIEENTKNQSKDTLLYSERLSLLFNIAGIFNKDVNLKRIIITNGSINIRIDSAGHGNYHFWKTTGDTSASGALDLQKIRLNNVYLKYCDNHAHQNYALLAKDADLTGKFGTGEFTLKTKAELFVDYLFIHGINYVDHKSVVINSGLSVNSKEERYKFDESHVKIAGVQFDVSGLISAVPSWTIDLSVKGHQSDIADFIHILPIEYASYFSKYNCDGKFLFSSAIKGSIENKNTPGVKVDFTVKDGSLSSKLAGAELDRLNFSGTFSSGKGKNIGSLNVPSLTAYLEGHQIKADFRLDNLPDAFLTLHAKTQLDLRELKPFIQSDTLESLSGDLAMNVFYSGKVNEITRKNSGQLYDIKASGNIDIKNVNLKLKNNPLEFKNMSGNFSLHNNDVQVSNFMGNISSSDFKLDGVFKNFISFLLIPGQSGNMQASLTSNIADLDELLINKSSVNQNDTSYILKFNPRIYCDMDVNIGTIHFRRFTATGIHGKVNLDKQVISSRGLFFGAMGGSVVMDARINASRRDSIMMDYDARFSKVDITRLFYEMENFDQHTMTDKNVKGKLTADVQFLSAWSNDLTLNSKSVRSTSNIIIEDGELLNFSPIQALAKYIHTPDLNHVKFSTLKNTVSISNRKIYIPHMDINSSAINISANGTHDFDNMVDYHIKLLLSDVLSRKVKNSSTEFGEIEDDGLGHSKLFLCMRGPVDDPHFSYDKKAAGDKLKSDIAQEKQNLKGLFKQEFGVFKNQPSVQAPKPKKQEEMQVDWSSE